MKTIKNGFFNIQLFAEPTEGASTPCETPTQQPTVDYEKELNNLRMELEKQKSLKDAYAKENAGYKKQLADKMTDDERNAQAQKEFEQRMANLEAENKQMKLEKNLLGGGFTTEECTKLIKANLSIDDISVLTNIIKEKVDLAVKSAKAEGIKEGTPSSPMGNGNISNAQEKSAFQKYQEGKQKENTNKEVKFN